MDEFLENVAISALMTIERDAFDVYLKRRDLTPELDAEDAARKAIQTAIYKTTELMEPNEISQDEQWLSELYWNEVST